MLEDDVGLTVLGYEEAMKEVKRVLDEEYKNWITWRDGLERVPDQHKICEAHLIQIKDIAIQLNIKLDELPRGGTK